MLEFNQEHKGVDLSTIKEKTKKSKKTGKIILCGILISSVLLLSGCGSETKKQQADIPSNITAIIMENGNALLIDLKSYDDKTLTVNGAKQDKAWCLHTIDGDTILIDFNSAKFVEGENSHEKAEFIAQSLIDENGKITCYDDEQSYGKTK